jgi:hypothetical protein
VGATVYVAPAIVVVDPLAARVTTDPPFVEIIVRVAPDTAETAIILMENQRIRRGKILTGDSSCDDVLVHKDNVGSSWSWYNGVCCTCNGSCVPTSGKSEDRSTLRGNHSTGSSRHS